MTYNNFDKNCIELLYQAPIKHSRHCFASALNHIDKANKLLSIDKEMAVFRAITAEEEAATGLMLCLRDLKYQNAEKLKARDHVHKSAVIQFISVILGNIQKVAGNTLGDFFFKINRNEKKPFLEIGIPLTKFGYDMIGWPKPPLNLHASKDGKKLSYKKNLAELLEETGKKDIITYVRALANERNQVLYAGQEGMAKVEELSQEYIDKRKARVMIMLRAYLLIYPYQERQAMVQDSLDAFLAMLGSLDYEGFHEIN